MQSRFFFLPPLADDTLLESLYAQLQAEGRRGEGGERGNKGTDEHPHDKEASPSAGARTSACFSFETYSGKVADMKINQCNTNEKASRQNRRSVRFGRGWTGTTAQGGAARKRTHRRRLFSRPLCRRGKPCLRPVTQVANPERCRCLVRKGRRQWESGKGDTRCSARRLRALPRADCCLRACVRACSERPQTRELRARLCLT